MSPWREWQLGLIREGKEFLASLVRRRAPLFYLTFSLSFGKTGLHGAEGGIWSDLSIFYNLFAVVFLYAQ